MKALSDSVCLFASRHKPVPLALSERHDREAADLHQRRVLEQRLGLDPVERLRCLEAFSHFDANDGDFGIACIHAGHRARAHRAALIAGMVEDPLRAFGHLAQVLDRDGIGDAVPYRFLIAQKIVEGVGVGLGLE